jgi:hypothetical protein
VIAQVNNTRSRLSDINMKVNNAGQQMSRKK